MKIEVGKTYLMNHTRKGTFAMRVDRQDETWTHGVIVGGRTETIMPDNTRYVGDPVSVRTSFLRSAVEQPE